MDIGPEFGIPFPKKPKFRGGHFVYKLPIDRGTFLTLRPKDGKANDVPLSEIDGETIEATSSNPEIITVELLDDQRVKVLPTGTIGTAQVNVALSVPATGEGDPTELTGILEFEVIHGGIASFTLEPGGDFPI